MRKQEILIIVSRSDQDIYDGRCEGDTLKRVLQLQGVSAKSIEVINEKMFIKALKIAKRENIKYVHINAHGFDEGFSLTDGDIVTWRDFDRLAWPILRGKCICFSSCSVGNGAAELFTLHKSFLNAILLQQEILVGGKGWLHILHFTIENNHTKSHLPRM